MREIKFRAWDKNFNKIYYKGFWVSCNYPNSDGDLCFDSKIFKPGKYSPLDLTLMQFTGLKDKNGKDIYEGDIIGVNGKSFGVVSWQNLTLNYVIEDLMLWALRKDAEVIGNIYENPELLK